LETHQLKSIRRLLQQVFAGNSFQTTRLRAAGVDANVGSLEEYTARAPLTTKDELVEDQAAHPPYGTNLTYPLARYTRFHQTSGTTGQPMRWLDTAESWAWLISCWAHVYESAGVEPADRVFFPFSFGPFLGFWAAFDAATRIGALAIPGGGLRSPGRLRLMLENHATVLCATPTYAVRLAEVASAEGIAPREFQVRHIILAGEPGGGIPATRTLIESLWPGARVVDHHGMTEIGPVTYECPKRPGVLHVMEAAFFPEVLDRETFRPVEPGGEGELVLTNLGRMASPLLRYRTGDVVRRTSSAECVCGSKEMGLEGGIIARTDEMFVVRGVNLYPSAVESVVRSAGPVSEFRVELDDSAALLEMRLEIEPAPGCSEPEALARRVQAAMLSAFTLRVPVRCVAQGALPRFETKAKRWVKTLR
jgi:phenylacetate-CoA ligase